MLHDLRELYQAVILDHAAHPRNQGKLVTATSDQLVHNPSCGDTIHIYLQVNQGRIVAIQFTGSGCTISQASASLLTTVIKGKTMQEALTLADHFSALAMGQGAPKAGLGDAAILTQVMQFPTRIKCATISWWALKQAILTEQEGKV